MNKGMKRAAAFLLALTMAAGLWLPALGELEWRINDQWAYTSLELPELGLDMRLTNASEWTIVTADTLEEHADLITARGDTMENARLRFDNAGILFEAYNPKRIPVGVIRVQAIEDEWSRNLWSLMTDELDYYNITLMRGFISEVSDSLYQGYLRLFNVRQEMAYGSVTCITGGVNWYPPYAYESGIFSIFCANGCFYMASYMSLNPASSRNFLSYDDMIYTYAYAWTPVSGIRMIQGVREETPVADLGTDWERLILNAHSGAFTLTGTTERGASVRVENGDQSWDAAVDGLNYTCNMQLLPGENTVVSVANKQGLRENRLERAISVDDAMAALELTEFPYGPVNRNAMKVSGKTSPGGTVTVTIDETEPRQITVQPDGAFSYTLPAGEAADWVDHTIEITAQEEGLADCAAKFTFSPEYEDAQQGIGAYWSTLSPDVNARNINADPAAHVGERAMIEVRTLNIDRRDGILSVECRIEEDRERPIVILYPNYMDDKITPQMVITVYGEVLEPAHLEPPVPRLEVEYTRNLIVEYVYR